MNQILCFRKIEKGESWNKQISSISDGYRRVKVI